MAHQLTSKTIESTYAQLIYRTTTVPSTGTTATQLLTSTSDKVSDIALPLYISEAHVGINTATPGTWLASATSDATYLDVYDSAQPAVLSLGGNETSNAAIVGIVQFINNDNADAANNNATGKIIADITVAIQADTDNAGNDCGGDMHFKTKIFEGSLATRMTIKDDGNVGIGITAPLANLHVRNPSGTTAPEILGAAGTVAVFEEANSAQCAIQMGTNTSKSMLITSASALQFYVDDDPVTSGNWVDADDLAMTILATKNVGIGESVPNSKLHVKGDNAAAYPVFFLECNEADLDDNEEVMRIDCSADANIHSSNSIRLISIHDAGGEIGYFTTASDGNINTAWTNVSDIRYKKDIVDTSLKGLETLNKIKVRDFKWNAKRPNIKNNQEIAGFIADELYEVYPYATSGKPGGMKKIKDTDGKVIGEEIASMGVTQGNLMSLLVKAVQELSAKVTALENA